MVTVGLKDRFCSDSASKRFGIPNQYGQIIYGISKYGEVNDFAGIYQTRHGKKSGKFVVREVFYAPKSQIQPNKVITQGIFRNAVIAWQALTTEQKEIYRARVKRLDMSGYNLFLKEYLLSH